MCSSFFWNFHHISKAFVHLINECFSTLSRIITTHFLSQTNFDAFTKVWNFNKISSEGFESLSYLENTRHSLEKWLNWFFFSHFLIIFLFLRLWNFLLLRNRRLWLRLSLLLRGTSYWSSSFNYWFKNLIKLIWMQFKLTRFRADFKRFVHMSYRSSCFSYVFKSSSKSLSLLLNLLSIFCISA